MVDAPKFSNRDKMRAAQREAGYRQFVYPKRVADGKMKQTDADQELAIMNEIAREYGAAAEQDDAAGRLI